MEAGDASDIDVAGGVPFITGITASLATRAYLRSMSSSHI